MQSPVDEMFQGGLRIKKKYLGSFFFFKPLELDLQATYLCNQARSHIWLCDIIIVIALSLYTAIWPKHVFSMEFT